MPIYTYTYIKSFAHRSNWYFV